VLPALPPAQLTNSPQPKWPANSDRPEGTPVSYGFGWFLDSYRNHVRMWHYGDTIGFHPYIQRFPADRLTIIVLCNGTDLDPESLAAKVADHFLHSYRILSSFYFARARRVPLYFFMNSSPSLTC